MRVIIDDLIGTPFEQMTCWQLVQEVYDRADIIIDDYTEYVSNPYDTWQEVDEPKEGDVLAFALDGQTVDHVGIYLGDGDFVHSTEYLGVVVEPLYRYNKRLDNIYRYIGEGA